MPLGRDVHALRGQAQLRARSKCWPIAIWKRTSTGKLDRLDVAYMRFENVSRQFVDRRDAVAAGRAWRARSRDRQKTQSQYEFLPSAESILEEVVPTSFKVKLFKCFLDAAVSEQVARMVAMKAATKSAGDRIKQLSMAVQPGPPVADHGRDHGNHRRRRGAEELRAVGGARNRALPDHCRKSTNHSTTSH